MRLRHICALATVLALGAICVSPASAQQGRGGRGGFGMGMGGGMGMLVTMKPVQEELKLTSDQIESATKVAEEAQAAVRESFGNLRDASPEDRRAAMEKMQKQTAETDKKILAALKPEQATRLKELSIQRRSVGALMDPEVATTLKLSDDQKTKLGEALRPGPGGPGGGGGGGGGGAGPNASDEERAAARERMTKAMKERETKALDILTADQRAEFTKMQGKKFDFPAPQGRPGGGGGGGGKRRPAST
ncbi:MAG TPA: hypothetical protein VGJ26_19260 [Pirellulales bacterium]|jgi:Spy/CpxP family protein refolding chaperone